MPELPEVEVVRLFLNSHIVGKTISKLEIITPKSFIGNNKLVEGQKIIKTSRIGKQLSIYLENNLILLFHLKMTGQIILGEFVFGHPTPREDKSILPNKSTRLILNFSNGSQLFFNDQRKFGWVKLLNQSELTKAQKNLGLDILNSKFTPKYFFNQLQNTSRPIKTALLDQTKFAGIGNIYANDALWEAKIHPLTPANSTSANKSKDLHQAVIDIIRESISHGGSTAKDKKYLKPNGQPGSHQYHFRVYQKAGEPCPRCHTPIESLKIAGRSAFYCPRCQKLK